MTKGSQIQKDKSLKINQQKESQAPGGQTELLLFQLHQKISQTLQFSFQFALCVHDNPYDFAIATNVLLALLLNNHCYFFMLWLQTLVSLNLY